MARQKKAQAQALRPGSTCRLEGGGPLLTVLKEQENGLLVAWFSGVLVLQQAVLPAAALSPAEDALPPGGLSDG